MTTAAYLGEFEQLLLLAILRSEEHTSELQSQSNLVCRLLLEKKKKNILNNETSKTHNRKPCNHRCTCADRLHTTIVHRSTSDAPTTRLSRPITTTYCHYVINR